MAAPWHSNALTAGGRSILGCNIITNTPPLAAGDTELKVSQGVIVFGEILLKLNYQITSTPTDTSVRLNIPSWENAADRMGPKAKAWSTGQLKDHLNRTAESLRRSFQSGNQSRSRTQRLEGFFFFSDCTASSALTAESEQYCSLWQGEGRETPNGFG